MVKIDWIIMDDFSGITLEEFDHEWCAIIGGDFELTINQNSIGYCSYRKKYEEEVGLEDVLYWLRGLLEGVKAVCKGMDYEMQLITRNRCMIKIEIIDCQKIKICLWDILDNELRWEEEVYIKEFAYEVYKNIAYFLKYVKEKNPILLQSEWIKVLYENDTLLYED